MGQKVKAGDPIAYMDIPKVRSANLNPHTMTVITNMEHIKSFDLIQKKQVNAGKSVFSYELA